MLDDSLLGMAAMTAVLILTYGLILAVALVPCFLLYWLLKPLIVKWSK